MVQGRGEDQRNAAVAASASMTDLDPDIVLPARLDIPRAITASTPSPSIGTHRDGGWGASLMTSTRFTRLSGSHRLCQRPTFEELHHQERTTLLPDVEVRDLT